MKLVSGMHRSGTSIVTRLLAEAGADLGDPGTFYAPDKWNPDGYFEQPEIHSVNMPLIHGLYWKLAYFRLPSNKTIMRRARRFSEKIRAISLKYNNKVVKGVRFCLTLPAWQAHGANIEKVLVCLREPFEVARSVQRRYKVSERRAYTLWVEHNLRLLENVGDIPLWFVHYARLLNPDTFASEVEPALEFFRLDHGEATLEILQALMRTPRHLKQGEVEYPPDVAELWRDLQRRHARQFQDEGPATTGQAAPLQEVCRHA